MMILEILFTEACPMRPHVLHHSYCLNSSVRRELEADLQNVTQPQVISCWSIHAEISRILPLSPYNLTEAGSLARTWAASTAEVYLERKGSAPAWQQLRVAYHGSLLRLGTDKPRLTLSFTTWCKKVFGETPSDLELKAVYGRFINEVGADSDDLQFNIVPDLSAEGVDPMLCRQVYMSISRKHAADPKGTGCYPGVAGSCMRHAFLSDCDGKHPVDAYHAPGIGLAWLTDDSGYTYARTLLNSEAMHYSRIYRTAPASMTMEQRSIYAESLEQMLRDKLHDAGYSCNSSSCLEGLRLNLEVNELPDGRYCTPFLDGSATCVDPETFEIGYDGVRLNTYSPPITDIKGVHVDTQQCCSCCNNFNENELEHNIRSGQWICDSCREEAYVCDICGDYVHCDSSCSHGDSTYCETCFDESFTYCEGCCKYHHKDDTTHIDDCSWCERCRDERFFECEDCANWISFYDSYTDYNGCSVCEACYKSSSCYCDECKQVYCSDEPHCPNCNAGADPEPEAMEATL